VETAAGLSAEKSLSGNKKKKGQPVLELQKKMAGGTIPKKQGISEKEGKLHDHIRKRKKSAGLG